MDELPNNAILYFDSNRGIYIPQDFISGTLPEYISGLSDWARDVLLAGPEHDDYWDAWHDVLDSVTITNPDGETFSLYQDGDLWLIPDGAERPEE